MARRAWSRLAEWRLRARAQVRLYGDPGRPVQAHICPTDRCNLSCRQCDIWRRPAAEELTTEEWQDVLVQLAALGGPGMSVNFSGGEPFLRDDLVDLIAFAVSEGMTVSANTNGWLIDDEMARRLEHAGLDILYVSLDGARPATHDRLRNRAGLFDRVMGALDALSRVPRPRVVVASILHRELVPEVEELLALCASRGLQVVFQPVYQPFGQAYDPGWHEGNPLLPRDLEAVDRAIDRLVAMRRRGDLVCNEEAQLQAFRGYFRAPTQPNGLSCRAGFRDISFNPRGDVLACYFLAPIGNVRKADLASIWWGREAALRRQEVAGCRRTCNLQNCNFGAISD